MNNEQLRAEIKRELNRPTTLAKTAELLNRCYVALGEPQCQHGNWTDCAKCDTPSPVQSAQDGAFENCTSNTSTMT